MTAPAAFKASFADFRLIKGRKVAQVIVEVPLEEADNALAALGGLPRPDVDRWVAVARLNGSPSPASIPEPARISGAAGEAEAAPHDAERSASAGGGEHKPKRERTLAEKVGMRCREKPFQQWLSRRYNDCVVNDDTVGPLVRLICGVETRAEIIPGTDAAKKWLDLETPYLADTNQMAEAR